MAEAGFEAARSHYRSHIKACLSDKKKSSTDSKNFGIGTERTALEQALRDELLNVLGKSSHRLDGVKSLVSLSIVWCRKGAAAASTPVVLLADAFDALTLDDCETLFAFVEERVTVWKEDTFFAPCKNNLLRMCNDLLRRLSRSQNTIFCGRILLFLAKFFPFSERSGLNIVSEFNLENVTELGADDDVKEEVDETKKTLINIDYNLYCKFWALQEFFRNPNLCYNKVQWKTFSAHSSSVLSAFNSYKLEAMQLKETSLKRKASMAMDVDQKEEHETHYFAKFLTNQKLLELQLSDSNFRRCILIQYLILFQYLQSSVKFKMDSFELKQDQIDWVKDTTDMIYKLIAETPPDGASFASRVKHILKREDLWNSWKNDGCPEFQKLKAPPIEQMADDTRKYLRPRRKRLLGDIVRDYEAQGKYYMGNNELTKQWNLCPNNLDSCKGRERDFVPSLESYLADAIDQAGRGVEGKDRLVADENFGWRALRLLASRSPHFFTYTNNIISKLPDYLETMIKKIAKDMAAAKQPDQESGEGAISEEQMEADLMKDGEQNYADQNQDADAQGENAEFDENKDNSAPKSLNDQQMMTLCEHLGGSWTKLAAKLGFKSDEILFFKENSETDPIRGSKMLEIYFESDEDASVENLLYVIEGLELMEAAAFLKEIEGN